VYAISLLLVATMRIRQYPTIAFCALVLVSAYLGLAPQTIPSYKQSDKVLHFVTFLLLTLAFYWILETSRRRVLHVTIFICPVCLGIGSEIAQGLLPNGRTFDPYDILANVLGSLVALAASTWYHKRMLERKRSARTYALVPGEEEDLELGEDVGHEDGLTEVRAQTLEEELDNWDENAEDWDADEATTAIETDAESLKAAGDEVSEEEEEGKKRSD